MTLSGERSSCETAPTNSDFMALASRTSSSRRALRSTMVACCAMPERNSTACSRSDREASEADREEADEHVLAIERGQDGGRERPAARAKAGRALGLGAGQHDERLRGKTPDRRPA